MYLKNSHNQISLSCNDMYIIFTYYVYFSFSLFHFKYAYLNTYKKLYVLYTYFCFISFNVPARMIYNLFKIMYCFILFFIIFLILLLLLFMFFIFNVQSLPMFTFKIPSQLYILLNSLAKEYLILPTEKHSGHFYVSKV